jgi:2-dehydropantoate 2-reductase
MNDERVASIAGRDRTLGCVITIGAGLVEAGHLRRTDAGRLGFRVGELDGKDTPRVRQLAEAMSAVAGAKVTTNLMGERWSKLAVNCMANPIAGLTGYGSAEVRSVREPSLVAVQIAAEVIRVGRASGHEVEPIYGIDPERYVDAAQGKGLDALLTDMAAGARFLTGGRPSMLQDVMKGRRTEIEYLNGWVVGQGHKVGVPTPLNEAIVRVVKSFPPGKLTPDPKNLAPLLAMLAR